MKDTTTFSTIPGLKGVVTVNHTGNAPTEARHLHESLCVGAVLDGTRHIVMDGCTEVLKSGDIIVLAPGQVHACPNAGHSSSTMLCISIGCMERFGFSTSGMTFPSPRINDPILFKRIIALTNMADQTSSELERDIALLDILETLSLATISCEPSTQQTSRQITSIRLHLEEYYTTPIKLDDLAKRANISPCRLNRAFSTQVGMPPHEYQTQLRVREVKQLIATGKSLAEAADLTGFSDQSHMTRSFKKVMGMTPGMYARGIRNRE